MKQRIRDEDEEEVVILQLQPTMKDLSSSDDEEGIELNIEEAFEKAGRFKWYQIRLWLLLLFSHISAPFHILAISFVGLSPEWSCSEDLTYPLNSSTINDHFTNQSYDDCALYEDSSSNCTPIYTDRFYSIAQEVN